MIIIFYILGGSCGCSILDIDDYTDIDIYFNTEADYDRMAEFLNCKCETLDFLNNSYRNATNYMKFYTKFSKDIQLIKRKFGSPQEIFEGFDLNKSCIGIDNNGVCYEDDFYEPLLLKRLNYDSLNRIYKYSKRFGEDSLLLKQTIHKFLSIEDNKPFELIDYYDNNTPIILQGEELVISFCLNIQLKNINFNYDEYFDITFKNINMFKSVDFSRTNCEQYEVCALANTYKSVYTEDFFINPFNISPERKSYILNKYPEYFL